MAAFAPCQQSQVVARGREWPVEPEIFTSWPFTEKKFANLCLEESGPIRSIISLKTVRLCKGFLSTNSKIYSKIVSICSSPPHRTPLAASSRHFSIVWAVMLQVECIEF